MGNFIIFNIVHAKQRISKQMSWEFLELISHVQLVIVCVPSKMYCATFS